MSKQEILAWTSLATSTSAIVLYVLIVFGWPEVLPDYSAQFAKIFFNVFWIAVAVEIVLELIKNKNKVEKDERDFKIEAYSTRYAYNFLSFAVAIILVNIFLSFILGDFSEFHAAIGSSTGTFHALFLVLFGANIVNRGTQIYHYQMDI